MQFSDLPKGGQNLRLYTYDPVGSPLNPSGGNPCVPGPNNGPAIGGGNLYNTGHFDIRLGVPCSQPDPQGFCSWDAMAAYAGSRGETLVMVSRDDLTSLCAYRAPSPQPTQTIVSARPGGVIQSGGVTGVNIVGGSTPGDSTPSGYIPPPGTPIEAGGTPGGVGTPGNTAGGQRLTGLYRFILYNPSQADPGNPYNTGANYPGCSAVNITNCVAKNFPSEQAAIAYAEAHGEVPYRVLSSSEPWGILDGSIPIDPSRLLGSHAVSSGMGLGTLAAIAGALWFLSGR